MRGDIEEFFQRLMQMFLLRFGRRAVAWATVTVGAVALAGCGSTGAFVPAEKATAVSPMGYPAAEYDLEIEKSDMGDARVWSEGAMRMELQGEKTTAVHVGFQLENTSDRPMRVDIGRTTLDVGLGKTKVINLQPTRIVGQLDVPPRGDRRIDLYFRLPKGVRPYDVQALKVKWELNNAQDRFSQQTPFIKPDPYVGRYYYTPFYDPFLYNPYWRPANVALYPYYPYWWY
jgi:hypothetical protein